MAGEIKNKDVFVVRDRTDLRKVVQRVIDQRDGNYAKPAILSEREKTPENPT